MLAKSLQVLTCPHQHTNSLQALTRPHQHTNSLQALTRPHQHTNSLQALIYLWLSPNSIADSTFISPTPSSSNETLFQGSQVSKDDGWHLIMSYNIQNHLSYKAITKLLELLKKLCTTPNNLPPCLEKALPSHAWNFYTQTFCSECEMELPGVLVISAIRREQNFISILGYHLSKILSKSTKVLQNVIFSISFDNPYFNFFSSLG